jgi:FtsH-binding integral membrane protein
MNEIVDYIRTNRKRYTREAISEQLLKAGHDRQAVADAWGQVDTEDVARGTLSTRYLLLAIGLIVIGVVGLFLVTADAYYGAAVAIFGAPIYVVVVAVAILIGVLAARPSSRDAPRKANDRSLGVLASLYLAPLIMWGLVTGTCYAMAGGA